ncbi:MAG: hypothetical protein IPG07_14860 [Crocinitomicaceae bacterium]|nr:hypothetical protein [Crocinitomicaceae bacterium]
MYSHITPVLEIWTIRWSAIATIVKPKLLCAQQRQRSGNGFIFHLLLAIPVVGIMLALPLSTIAATTETIKKLKLNKTD